MRKMKYSYGIPLLVRLKNHVLQGRTKTLTRVSNSALTFFRAFLRPVKFFSQINAGEA